jgi:hypothetical protein
VTEEKVEQQPDEFAGIQPEAVDTDPLTGQPRTPAPPAADDLPPGVVPGSLGGTDTAEPEQPAAVEEQPTSDLDTGEQAQQSAAAPATAPAPPAPPADPPAPPVAPPAPDEDEPAGQTVPPPRSERRAQSRKSGGSGAATRPYVLLEEVKASEITDPDEIVYRPFKVGNEDTVTCRNGNQALRLVAKAAGVGFERRVAPIPISYFQPTMVRATERTGLGISIGESE